MRVGDNRFLDQLCAHFSTAERKPFCRLRSPDGTADITWADLEAGCRSFGAVYGKAGLTAGDTVLIFTRSDPSLFAAFFGAMLQGLVPSFMPPASPRQDAQLYWSSHTELLAHIQPAAIVAEAAVFAEMRQAGLSLGSAAQILLDAVPSGWAEWNIPASSAIALLQHSSGTTGLKKGVALSYDAIVAQLDSYGTAIAVEPRDIVVSWLPLYHDMGLIACLLLPTFFGLELVQIDPFVWLSRPASLFDAIAEHRGTLTWLPNFAFEHMSNVLARHAARYDLSSMRAFIDCSEPCKPQTLERFAETFAAANVRPEHLQVCYAMAETVFAVTQTGLGSAPARVRVHPDRLGIGQQPIDPDGTLELLDVGTPIAGVDMRFYDETNRQVPDGTIGEIGIAAPFLFSGYNRDAARTEQVLIEGRYFSRDIGFRHDGRCYIIGRKDDLIIVNGRNLYAHEVEAALKGIPGLKAGRAVALGTFDTRVGSNVLVVIAERDGATTARAREGIEADVMTAVNSVFSVLPKAVSIVDEGWLVKTTSGKISRKENLARYLAGRTSHGV